MLHEPESENTIVMESTPNDPRDLHFMALALEEARRAAAEDEVPMGAVVVLEGAVLATAHNHINAWSDPTAHAELVAISAAARASGYARLLGATIYSTVEPCFMCAGALVQARVARAVWGVRDPKFGGCVSLGRVLDDPRLNHRVEPTSRECAPRRRASSSNRSFEANAARRGAPSPACARETGEVPERLIGLVSKTSVYFGAPGVQIPPSPPRPAGAMCRCSTHGEVSERLKEHAWKACVSATAPRVRIPPSPPSSQQVNADG